MGFGWEDGRMRPFGRVAEIWRYPVKSMLGESLVRARIGELGLDGDRRFGVLDLERGSVLSAKRAPRLFGCRASYDEGGDVLVDLPGGETLGQGDDLDGALSALLERPVKLVSADEHPSMNIQMAAADDTTEGESSEWPAPPGTFFDASPIHFLTTATLDRFRELYPDGDFDPRRFRANLVIDTGDAEGFQEKRLIGGNVTIGDVELRVTKACSRCVMTTLEQPDLERDRGILKTIAAQNANNLGVRAFVSKPGNVAYGDALELQVRPRASPQRSGEISADH
jgi:uncharacterized protein